MSWTQADQQLSADHRVASMGCASSGPLSHGNSVIQSAKGAVEDMAEKGEQVLHDMGEHVKEEFSHVKDAMGSMITSAEHGLEHTKEKITDAFSHKKEEAEEAIETAKDDTTDAVNKFSEAVGEEISEAETILASETEDVKEKLMDNVPKIDNLMVEDLESSANEKMENTVTDVIEMMPEDTLTVEKVEEKIEASIRPPTPVPIVPDLEPTDKTEGEETKNDEPATPEEKPTQWELEADAILNRPIKVPKKTTDVEHEAGPSKWIRRGDKDEHSNADETECLRAVPDEGHAEPVV